MLNWIWGIGNGVWIALLCLIPGVNFIVMIVLGLRGSRWAWNARLWRDEDHFKRSQRRWAIAGIIVWVLVLGFFVLIFTSVFGALKGSDAYRMSMEEVRASTAVQAALGQPIDTGFFVTGNISLNADGGGRAQLRIPLKGPRGAATAYSQAIRNAGAWDLRLLIVRIPGREDPIVIINKSNLPLPGSPLET